MPESLRRWLKTLAGAVVAATTLVSAAAGFAVQFGWGAVGKFGFWLTVLVVAGFGLLLVWRLWVVANRLRSELVAADARLAEEKAQHAAGLEEIKDVVVGSLQSVDDMWRKAYEDQSAQVKKVLESAEERAGQIAQLNEGIGRVSEQLSKLSG